MQSARVNVCLLLYPTLHRVIARLAEQQTSGPGVGDVWTSESAPRVTQYCNNWPSVASSKEILGPLNGRLPSMPSQRNSIPGPEAPQRRAYGASPRGRARDGVREHVPPRVRVLGKTLNCLVKCSKSQKRVWTSEPLPVPCRSTRRADVAVLPSMMRGRNSCCKQNEVGEASNLCDDVVVTDASSFVEMMHDASGLCNDDARCIKSL